MAKIIFVTTELSYHSLNQISNLKKSGHHVIVLTSKKELNSAPSHCHSLFFFKTWNLLEGFKLIPHLFSLDYEMVYFFVDSMSCLKKFKTIFRIFWILEKTITTHFYLSEKEINQSPELSYFCYYSHVIIGSNRALLAELRGIGSAFKSQIKGVLFPSLLHPPLLSNAQPSELDINQFDIFIPWSNPLLNKDLIRQLSKSFKIAIGIDFDRWTTSELKKNRSWLNQLKNSWSLFPINAKPLSWTYEFNSNTVIWLAETNWSLSQSFEIISKGIQNNSSFVIDRYYFRLFPELWENYNRIILIDGPLPENKSLSNLFQNKPGSLDWQKLNDRILNELNRLLTKAGYSTHEKIS